MNEVIYLAEENSLEKSTVKNISDFLAWKDGKLVLRNITLKEACMKLSHYYHVDFELQAKGLDNMEIQLTLENETLESALDLLSLISPVSYKVEDRIVQNNQTYSKKKIIIKKQIAYVIVILNMKKRESTVNAFPRISKVFLSFNITNFQIYEKKLQVQGMV